MCSAARRNLRGFPCEIVKGDMTKLRFQTGPFDICAGSERGCFKNFLRVSLALTSRQSPRTFVEADLCPCIGALRRRLGNLFGVNFASDPKGFAPEAPFVPTKRRLP